MWRGLGWKCGFRALEGKPGALSRAGLRGPHNCWETRFPQLEDSTPKAVLESC